MRDRLELHEKLCEVLGSNKVYYQPPETVKLSYPCIVYELDTVASMKADNIPYLDYAQYSITHIYKDVESDLIGELSNRFSYCSHDRRFKADNLYHDVYRIYY